jgi:probable HAF family extracellular repeat protein
VAGEKSMKNCRSRKYALGFVLTFMVVATAAAAPTITFKFTSVSVPNAISTVAEGVNNAGVIVGFYQDSTGKLHGFMLNGKKVTTIDHPKGTATECLHVNPNGAPSIVGYYTTSSGTPVGFLYQNGTFTDIPGPAGATGSYAYGINDNGLIVARIRIRTGSRMDIC